MENRNENFNPLSYVEIVETCKNIYWQNPENPKAYETYIRSILNKNQEEANFYIAAVRMELAQQIYQAPLHTVDERMQKSGDKSYVIKPSGRNGFVNALLLSLITMLFGSLCLAYIITGVMGR